ncbi:MAG TPA: site-specific DNA-methyltransferase, partial [Gallicola sp.]|nr:site-specific DNA-methyltransferase [Gallicola sp.]
ELLHLSLKLKKQYDKNNDKEINFYNESAVMTDKKIKDIDLVVTSPPYANMFDYFEVYKMELWTSGLIDSYEQWKKFKKSALRSNKNANIKKEDIIDNEILKNATTQMEKNDVDNATIAMVNNYFYDMKMVMEKMYNFLNKKGYMFIVVGNSFYGGIPIITDEILIEEAKKIGFTSIDMIVSRKLSTSSQQMKIISDENRIYLRESIIVLRKDK